MNSIQKHIVKLLSEVDEICTNNGIPYILYGRTARDAYKLGTFCGEYMSASVIIPAAYFERIEKIVQERPDRNIEWVCNNPVFPGLHMRYVDENTTFLYGDSIHKYQNHGIYITIERCRNIPKRHFTASIANYIEKIIEYSGAEIENLSKKKRLGVKVFCICERIFGKKRMIRAMLRFQAKITKNKSDSMAVIRYLKDNYNISKKYFSNVKRVNFCGKEFLLPTDSEKYLEKVFGKSWMTMKPLGVSAPHLLVADTNVPYRDIEFSSNSEEYDISDAKSRRAKTMEQMDVVKKKIEHYWDILFMTKARYDMFKKYIPFKQEIMRAYIEKDFVTLRMVFSELITVEELYMKKGLVVSVDNDINKLAIEVMKHIGKQSSAAKMEMLLAESADSPPINCRIPEKDAELWPLRIKVDGDGRIPVGCVLSDGSYNVFGKTADGRIINVLYKSSGKITPVESSEYQDLCFEKDGVFYTLNSILPKVFGKKKYIFLTQTDYMQRCMILAALTLTNEIIPLADTNENNIYIEKGLPVICEITSSREIPCFLEANGKNLGKAYWISANGKRHCALAAGPEGRICLTPHFADSKLVCVGEDGNENDINLYAASQIGKNAVPGTNSDYIPYEFVQEDFFGNRVLLAKIVHGKEFISEGIMNENGIFIKSSKTVSGTVFDSTKFPMLYINNEGVVVPTVFAEVIDAY